MDAIRTARALALTDATGREVGTIRVTSVEGDLILGEFAPGPDYPAVEPVFRFLGEIIDQQSFSFLDEAEEAVARLGVTARPTGGGRAVPVRDLQIYLEGDCSCRVPAAPAGRNGHTAEAR